MPEAKLYRWSEIDPEPLNPLFTRQFIHGEKAMVARILFKKGARVPEHTHENEQISCVLSGTLELTVAGTAHILRAGELMVIPANLPHSAHAHEDTENLDIFAPPREDWISGDDAYLR